MRSRPAKTRVARRVSQCRRSCRRADRGDVCNARRGRTPIRQSRAAGSFGPVFSARLARRLVDPAR
eukprot:12732-Pelagococcus_subviridis.AAC.1